MVPPIGLQACGIKALPVLALGYFLEPESVREAKAAFVAASDAVRAWVDEQCTLDFDSWTARTALYNAYQVHTINDASKLLSAREFYNRIEQINGIVATKRNGERGFHGIKLRVDPAAPRTREASSADGGG